MVHTHHISQTPPLRPVHGSFEDLKVYLTHLHLCNTVPGRQQLTAISLLKVCFVVQVACCEVEVQMCFISHSDHSKNTFTIHFLTLVDSGAFVCRDKSDHTASTTSPPIHNLVAVALISHNMRQSRGEEEGGEVQNCSREASPLKPDSLGPFMLQVQCIC